MNKTVFFDSLYSDYHFHLFELSFSSNPPKPVINTVKIPGLNGVIDLSDYPLGYPIFEQREASWRFAVNNKYITAYSQIINDITDNLLGKKISFEKTENQGWIYNGRITEIKEERDGVIRYVIMKAKCDPFLTAKNYTELSFNLGTNDEYSAIDPINIFWKNSFPELIEFKSGVNCDIRHNKPEQTSEYLNIESMGDNWNKIEEFTLSMGENKINAKYSGSSPETISIRWKNRRL